MKLGRRSFLGLSATAAGAAALGVRRADAQPPRDEVPKSIRDLKPMTAGVVPISDEERRARVEKARRLMAENRIDALVLEGGSSMAYFTGVRWGLSERPFAVVIPQKGELAWITPKFEEERARELIRGSTDVRAWEEDESPYRLLAAILRDRGAAAGRVGVEERVRFFVFDGLRREAPRAELVAAEAVTAGCRVIKSPAEIALMQRANDITIAAYRAAFPTFHEGMTQDELRGNVEAAFAALGAPGGSALVSFGKYTAFPHGSVTPQRLREGDVVLVDGGCAVQGYQSDVTRTTVFGRPTQRQRDVWELEKRAQLAALDAAKVGAPCEAVDAAARKVITDAGFGPDYRTPGLPHRTGHGIGMDGHEWTNLVRGNRTPLAPGMCFSDEPTIVIYGEFGVRLEDCFHMTESGPKLFTELSPAIDRPFPAARSAS